MHEFIKLESEVERIKTYVEIENFRFSNAINLQIEIEDKALMEMYIPSFILQPLVENAIIHGIFPKKDSGNIKLKIYSNDTKLFLDLADDGIGFQENKVSENSSHKSIALDAISQRLYSMTQIYNQEFRITIEKILEFEETKGTIVKIILPIFITEPS